MASSQELQVYLKILRGFVHAVVPLFGKNVRLLNCDVINDTILWYCDYSIIVMR